MVHPLGSGSVDPTPYEAQSVNAHVSPAVSGQVSLVLPPGTTPRPSNFAQVCSWIGSGKPQPLGLILSVNSGTGNQPSSPYLSESSILSQLSGFSMGTVGASGGAVRVTYGLGSSIRTLEADLRSGTFQLPPCDYANVEAFLHVLGPAAANVSAALVPGLMPSPSRMVASWRPTLAPGTSASEAVPFGARWVSMAGGNADGIGPGGPQLRLRQGISGPVLVHDWVNGIFISQPGQPVELASRGTVTLANTGTVGATVTVRFYLEP